MESLTLALTEGPGAATQAKRDKALAADGRKLEKLVRARFRAQRKAILASHALRQLVAKEAAETDEQARARIEQQIAASIGPVVYGEPVTAKAAAVYDGAIRNAATEGLEAVTSDFAPSFEAANQESFVSEYLKDGGFTRLTGQIDKTTVDRIASALADAYEEGADFDGVAKAVKGEFADMTEYRARMIAQTELNDAFNQSIMHFGAQAGATKKAWMVDLAPCVICIANSLEGDIDLEDDFESGDDAPPAHPNCLCSLVVSA